MPHPSEDDLALVALGEVLPEVGQHVAGCAECAQEVAVLVRLVGTARGADPDVLAPAPPAVWDRIRSELDLGSTTGQVPGPRPPVAEQQADQQADQQAEPAPVLAPVPARSASRRLAVAGLALAAGLAVVLVAVGLPGREATTTLSALGADGASGRAELSDSTLVVSTQGLPEPDGTYEVWLLDPDDGRMVPLGTLGGDGAARLALPAGVRPGDFPAVDISLEPDDGDPTHSGDSVLRGDVPV